MPPALSQTCAQQIGFKLGGSRHFWAMQERVYHGRKFDSVDQLKQAIVLECRTATDHGTVLRWSQQRIMETSFELEVSIVDQNAGQTEHTFQ